MSGADPGWDTDRTRHFAGWLAWRRERAGLLDVGVELLAMPSLGEAMLRFAAALGDDSTQEKVEERFEWEMGDHHDGVPYSVIRAMLSCQKPFQLWNVERVERSYRYRLDPGPELKLGGAARLEAEEQVPREIPKATQELIQQLDQAELLELADRSQRRRFAQLLREPLPFGVPDEQPATPSGPTINPFAALLGGGPPPETEPAPPPPVPRGAFPPGLGPPSAEIPAGLPPHIAERLRKKRAEQAARREQQERERRAQEGDPPEE